MASPQKENGHTPIANEILEHLVQGGLLGSELSLLLLVIRKTYGWHKKEDIISLTQFERGLKLSRHTVIKAIKNLVYRKMLVKGATLGNTKIPYKFNKNWEEWVVQGGALVQNNDRSSAVIKQKVVQGGAHTKETTKDNTKEIQKSSPIGDSHMRIWNEDTGEWVDPPVKEKKELNIPKAPACFILWQRIAMSQAKDGVKEGIRLPEHSSFTSSFKAAYWVARKKGFGDAEIEHAIKVYASVLESPKSYWTKRYNFSEFMKYAYEKFIGKNPSDFAGKIKN